MASITAIEVFDIRFPTSDQLDGSDAMNKDGDYSAAYVVLTTDEPGLSGYGLTFTIGRGTDLCVRAARQIATPLLGWDVDDLGGAGMGSVVESHQVRLTTALARAGKGRRAPGDRRSAQFRMGPRLRAVPASRCGACCRTWIAEQLVAACDFSYLG